MHDGFNATRLDGIDEILAVGNITHHKFCPFGNSGAKTVTQVVVHDDLMAGVS